jgi:ABC-type sugar transport system ATPase subunit
MPALSVRGLTIARGGRLVVEDVSFSAQVGAITAVLGEAGAGKTTLLAGIAGLAKSERGAVLVGGRDVTRLRPSKRDIGFLPPGMDLGSGRTVLAAMRRVAGRKTWPAIEPVLAGLHIESLQGLRLGDATHGQGFAVLAGTRLLPEGAVLLVDEAGIGLDEAGKEDLLAWLRAEAANGRTILLATRTVEVALSADHLVLLRDGHVWQAGAPASVFAEPRDGVAALMTGPANLLHGKLRQKIPGGFVWMAQGLRFTQQDAPGQATPALGSDVRLCLRPDHVAVAAAAGPNSLPGSVTRLVCKGSRTEIWLDTAIGPIRATISGPPAVRSGMVLELSWDPAHAALLSG